MQSWLYAIVRGSGKRRGRTGVDAGEPRLRRAHRPLGEVTLPQFRTLVVIAVRGPQRSIDIADELQVNPSTGTRMLDRLIRKGLVRRSRSTSDRRVVRIRLTRAGHDVVEQVMARRRADLERLVAETADLWRPEVTTALTAFARAAGEVGEHDWWLGWAAHRDDVDAEPEPVR